MAKPRPGTSPWICCFAPRPQASLRLFCFPYAGGSASQFRTWSEHLPTEVEVCPIQLPGRENRLREAPFIRLGPLVRTLVDVLRPRLDLPFAFFGHSMGALISFELARELRRAHDPGPAYLVVSGCGAPQLPNPNPPIHHLPDPEFIEELRRLNGTPEQVLQHPELLKLILPCLRADLEIVETCVYADGEPLDCAVSALGGELDPEARPAAVAAWREQTRGPFRVRMLPGDHFFLHTERALLLQAIAEDLARHLGQTA